MVSILVHAFLPHHSNNHKARALHVDAFLLYVLAFLAFQIVTWVASMRVPDVLGYATDIHLEQLLSLTNAKRKEAGIGELSLNSRLSEAAAAKAADMFAKGYWAHTSPDGKLPWDFIVASGYTYTVAGENLAKNFNDSSGVVNAWMDSPSHKENLLKPNYRDIGFAVVNGVLNGEETTLVVQMFGASSNAAVAQATTQQAPFIPAAQAEEPEVTPESTVVPTAPPTPTVTAIPTENPVVVTHVAFTTDEAAGASAVGTALVAQFRDVVRNPLINLGQLNKWVSFVFVGFLIAVLAIDWWVVRHRKIARVSGRSHAHIIFFIALLIFIGMALPGSIL